MSKRALPPRPAPHEPGRGARSVGAEELSRRRFFRFLLPLWILSARPIHRAQAATDTGRIAIPLAKLPQLQQLRGGVLLKIRGQAVLLIRTAEDRVSALEPECTHKKCQVLYEREWGEIRCDCHGSKYNLQGVVLNPPATRNLRTFPVEMQGDRILLDLKAAPHADP
jgi:Rieske Fe-S protein